MKLVPLKALGSIYTGNTPSKKEQKFYEAKDIPFIKPDIISDSKLSEITHTEEYISNLARNNARIIPKNSILVTCIGSIGKIGITGPGEYAFNQQINAIVPNAGINVRYLAYCLLFNKKKLCEIANNAVVPIINKKQFSDFCVSINPDIKVQKNIVRTLDILACIIKHRQTQLAKLDELVKCRFVEKFGLPSTTSHPSTVLRDVATIKHGYAFKGEYFSKVCNDIVLVTPGNFKVGGGFQEHECRYFTGDYPDEFVLEPGSLIVTMTDLSKNADTLGYAALIPEHSERVYLHNQRIGLINLKPCMNKYFVCYYMQTEEYRINIVSTATGSTVHHTSPTRILDSAIMLPPLSLQKEFENFVRRIDKLRFVIQKSLDETQKLFDSLMQEYFD